LCDTGLVVGEIPVTDLEAPLCCPPLGDQARLSANEAIEVAWRLRALAEPARVSIVSILAGREDHARTTRELAPLVGLTEATVSHHLKQLAEAGLVTRRRDGARVYYRLDVAAVRAISAVLDVCCACAPEVEPRR
jgi:ArsR family transcriptional regulator